MLENVLAIPKAQLLDILDGRSDFIFMTSAEFEMSFDGVKLVYKERKFLESITEFVQLIPYVIINYKDTLCTYKRGNTSKEKQLSGMISIGFGGHIEEIDQSLTKGKLSIIKTVENCWKREISEELLLSKLPQGKILGVIYSDATVVSSKHCAIVICIEVDNNVIATIDPSIILLGFRKIVDVDKMNNVELWSKLLLPNLYDYLIRL